MRTQCMGGTHVVFALSNKTACIWKSMKIWNPSDVKIASDRYSWNNGSMNDGCVCRMQGRIGCGTWRGARPHALRGNLVPFNAHGITCQEPKYNLHDRVHKWFLRSLIHAQVLPTPCTNVVLTPCTRANMDKDPLHNPSYLCHAQGKSETMVHAAMPTCCQVLPYP
jgi:hypothetical protein